MRIALDLDGVVYNWERTARFLLKQNYGYDLPISTSWLFIKDNVSAAAWAWLWSGAIKDHGLFRHGHLYKGSIDGVRNLALRGDVVVVTSRPKLAVQDTLEWLGYHRLPVDEVHILSKGQPKTSVSADVLIDDCADNIRDWVYAGRSAIVFDRPWNQGITALGDVRRAHSWAEVIDFTDDIDLERKVS